ncbi:c-type cytochrome [Gemmobacter nectariphilus]|uniref:c-type cytochrome n=1 Tax=Gemmobacter nectariphilus TaxID=220343 RepID=UPI00040058E4|nr:cytochrome c [Gemmobacter nectariphilus]
MTEASRKAALAAALTVTAAALAACLPGLPQRDPGANGARLYADYCAACHGATGKGDGPAAEGVKPRPADLTGLAAANGGKFPQVAVMAKVYGYHQGKGGIGPMPEFGPLLEGPTVLVETAPGVMTPTPEKLVALAEHVERLGRN